MSALLLFDIGNTHVHLGIANDSRVVRSRDIPTSRIPGKDFLPMCRRFIGSAKISGVAVASVVPPATLHLRRLARKVQDAEYLELNHATACIGINYPSPKTIGPDRLANAIAARHYFGAPVIVVDFGTAVTFDIVDSHGHYVGGVIAPGLAAMTDYLHEKTALLPRIKIREVQSAVGKSTREAMLIGAVHGYRGLIRELLGRLKRELHARRLPVVATGGYAALIAREMPEINSVNPMLTLEGLRLAWFAHHDSKASRSHFK